MALPRVAVWRRIVRMMRMDLKNPPTTVEGGLKRRIVRVQRRPAGPCQMRSGRVVRKTQRQQLGVLRSRISVNEWMSSVCSFQKLMTADIQVTCLSRGVNSIKRREEHIQ
jgi:hypothetical protein